MTLRQRRVRVLAIDDEPAMIEWLKMLLDGEGFEVRTAMGGARGEELFRTFMNRPDRLPAEWHMRVTAGNDLKTARLVADYIAGMTDRFALREHQRLTGQAVFAVESVAAEPALRDRG